MTIKYLAAIFLLFGSAAFGHAAAQELNVTDEGHEAESTQPEVAVDYRGLIIRYYHAYRERDRDTLQSLLTPDFHFVSSFGEHRNRDAMLDEIWPVVGVTWAVNLRIFGEGPDFVVLYEHENTAALERPAMSMAEYIRFECDKIAAIEVFTGREIQESP